MCSDCERVSPEDDRRDPNWDYSAHPRPADMTWTRAVFDMINRNLGREAAVAAFRAAKIDIPTP